MIVANVDKGSRDGRLAIISDDRSSYRLATSSTLQSVLDGNPASADSEDRLLQPERLGAPLPRAYQFLDGSAYVNHVALVRKARGAEMPEHFWTDPLMYQGCSSFLGPTDDIQGDPAWGLDFEAEIAVITLDVRQGVSPEEAVGQIAYVMLLNDISLRNLIPQELSKGFGFVQSKPPSACSPFAVTPDALTGWDGRKLHGTLNVDLNGKPFGRANAGVDMTFDFSELLAHAAKTRPLPAGTVIGSGTISNRDAGGGPGKPVAQGGLGYSCIAEQRMVETIETGAAITPFLSAGDHVRIWMDDENGNNIFGAIDQVVAPWEV
ncbi:MAG: fumarylacetoacetate hydrolase family protein [Pseudomonadota bacterium]